MLGPFAVPGPPTGALKLHVSRPLTPRLISLCTLSPKARNRNPRDWP